MCYTFNIIKINFGNTHLIHTKSKTDNKNNMLKPRSKSTQCAFRPIKHYYFYPKLYNTAQKLFL